MRLINTLTYKFEEHFNPEPYAILSHTWREGEEVSFAEYAAGADRHKSGYAKIKFLCEQARRDGLRYAWIDTCCIDKSSSAELSEAINSMYAWYKEAKVCYVYLDDVEKVEEIEHCRWLTRGWTLQELIAPTHVQFYGTVWTHLGSKSQLIPELVAWTNIDQVALENQSAVKHISVATRMSWAAPRRTTRTEDMAYCLLGIFEVNMPLIYGEREKAFTRLQEEILKTAHELSLLAFDRSGFIVLGPNMLAPNPAAFLHTSRIVDAQPRRCEVNGSGLVLDVQLIPGEGNFFHVPLSCRFEFDHGAEIALSIEKVVSDIETENCFTISNERVATIVLDRVRNAPYQRILLLKEPEMHLWKQFFAPMRYVCRLHAEQLLSHGCKVFHAAADINPKIWHERTLCSEIETYSERPIVQRFAFVCEPHDEAFIVGVAVISRGRGLSRFWFNTSTKPQHIDCETWLRKEGMIATQRHTTSTYQKLESATVEEQYIGLQRWTSIPNYLRNTALTLEPPKLSLLSQRCFKGISLSGEQKDYHRWSFTISPTEHECATKDLSNTMPERPSDKILRSIKKRIVGKKCK